jgi:hypothetical protein
MPVLLSKMVEEVVVEEVLLPIHAGSLQVHIRIPIHQVGLRQMDLQAVLHQVVLRVVLQVVLQNYRHLVSNLGVSVAVQVGN